MASAAKFAEGCEISQKFHLLFCSASPLTVALKLAQFYSKLLRKNPLTTKSLTSAVIAAGGSWIAQNLKNKVLVLLYLLFMSVNTVQLSFRAIREIWPKIIDRWLLSSCMDLSSLGLLRIRFMHFWSKHFPKMWHFSR